MNSLGGQSCYMYKILDYKKSERNNPILDSFKTDHEVHSGSTVSGRWAPLDSGGGGGLARV